ncbi:uncharacterized protein RHIMIDRAFT_232885 [Rhizopus microsporus ATCC 52813]|uniref:Uncharacterized protein n=1 Tax=Rhizopus microsporus ATCC 52813 TaxID=1340429 RepID=A0A2G4T9R6_RHIZD|nr:uncharacterized protein RHIMIDRAFT_232885 [Rhizopus microsporus ATCC 52813]PHZ17456.1 hypothetical protein RHIMIDRAFT_232885 [Rhizopus microsporus ATCC 52813]
MRSWLQFVRRPLPFQVEKSRYIRETRISKTNDIFSASQLTEKSSMSIARNRSLQQPIAFTSGEHNSAKAKGRTGLGLPEKLHKQYCGASGSRTAKLSSFRGRRQVSKLTFEKDLELMYWSTIERILAVHILLTTISLQRNIDMTLTKLEIIFTACLQNTVKYLALHIGAENNNFFFSEDSPGSVSSNESNHSNEWELAEQGRRIIEYIANEINNLSYGNDVLCGVDLGEPC